MATWLTIPFDIPANNQTVWIRIDRWTGTPFLAIFKSQQQRFDSVTGSMQYPFWVVSRWRPQ